MTADDDVDDSDLSHGDGIGCFAMALMVLASPVLLAWGLIHASQRAARGTRWYGPVVTLAALAVGLAAMGLILASWEKAP